VQVNVTLTANLHWNITFVILGFPGPVLTKTELGTLSTWCWQRLV